MKPGYERLYKVVDSLGSKIKVSAAQSRNFVECGAMKLEAL
jgi:hypothetical protein